MRLILFGGSILENVGKYLKPAVFPVSYSRIGESRGIQHD